MPHAGALRRYAACVTQQTQTLMSPEDLAAYLGVPLATVYRWRTRHEADGRFAGAWLSDQHVDGAGIEQPLPVAADEHRGALVVALLERRGDVLEQGVALERLDLPELA